MEEKIFNTIEFKYHYDWCESRRDTSYKEECDCGGEDRAKKDVSHILKLFNDEVIKEIESRAWLHIDEVDSKIRLNGKTVKHSADFGKGWNANSEDMVEFLYQLREKLGGKEKNE